MINYTRPRVAHQARKSLLFLSCAFGLRPDTQRAGALLYNMHGQLEVLYNAHALEVSSLSLLPLCCCFGFRSDTQRGDLGHATILLNCVRSKFVLLRTKKKSFFGKHASSNSISTFTEDDHRTAKPSFFFFSGGPYRGRLRGDKTVGRMSWESHAMLTHWNYNTGMRY